MGGSVIKIEGLEKTLARFDVKKFEPQITKAFSDFGERVEETAKQLAPVDEGHLKGLIFFKGFKNGVEVGCSVDYAAFVEFGTRKYAARYVSTLPATWQQLAAKSKGKGGGSFEEFVQRIFAWVRRKGIGSTTTKSGAVSTSATSLAGMNSAAYAIALNILQNGSQPHPFLYPAVNMHYKQLIKDLQELTFDSTGFTKQSIPRRVFR